MLAMDENRARPACALRQTTRSNTAMTDLPAAPAAEWICTAERQVLRSDGIKELHALHEMLCDDGTLQPLRIGVFVLN
jgi:hypothetical protein